MKTWVRYWRVRQGMTQAELARKANITQPKLSNLEQGKGNPRLSTLARIAEALGITIKDLHIQA